MSKNENKTIVLTSSANPLTINVLKSNFKNSEIKFIPEDYSPFNREELAIEINNTYKQVIFYGYYNQFYLLLPLISKKVVKKYIINISVPQLATQYLFTSLLQVLEYQDRGLIDFIATTRYDLYVTFKDRMNYITLDYSNKIKPQIEDSIGILNDYYLNESNFYNELSAIALSSIKKATVRQQNNVTKKFGLDFGIDISVEDNIEKLIYKNKINLDCKFCDISPVLFIMSMDAGIPCILGNTNILNEAEELKKYLVLESDDNVNEIKEKIELALSSKEIILKLYSKWRNNYSKSSAKTVDNFIKLGGN